MSNISHLIAFVGFTSPASSLYFAVGDLNKECIVVNVPNSEVLSQSMVKGTFPSVIVVSTACKDFISIIRSIRSLDGERHTGIIVFSEDTVFDPETAEKALLAGADDVFYRDISRQEASMRMNTCLKYKLKADELRRINHSLRIALVHDNLTGAYNMIGINQQFSALLKENVFVMMLDIDKFKNVNDSADHLFGSFCLREFANRIQVILKDYKGTNLGRFGGDEFTIIGNLELNDAKELAGKILKTISDNPFKNGSHEIALTTSIGVCLSKKTCLLEDMIKKADKELYKVKRSGRNQASITSF